MPRAPTAQEIQQVAERFWSRVDRADPTVCWPYPLTPNVDGYTSFQFRVAEGTDTDDRKRLEHSHRMACRLAHGEPIDEQHNVVRHSCLTKSCVNPAHLQWGSHQENRADTVAMGRQAKTEDNGRAKLTEEIVEGLIRRVRGGEALRTTFVARELGVDPKAIRQIRDRKKWITVWERVEAEDQARSQLLVKCS